MNCLALFHSIGNKVFVNIHFSQTWEANQTLTFLTLEIFVIHSYNLPKKIMHLISFPNLIETEINQNLLSIEWNEAKQFTNHDFFPQIIHKAEI